MVVFCNPRVTGAPKIVARVIHYGLSGCYAKTTAGFALSLPHYHIRSPRGFLSHGVHSSCALVCLHVRCDDTLDGIGVN